MKLTLVETIGPELAELFVYPGPRHPVHGGSVPPTTLMQRRW